MSVRNETVSGSTVVTLALREKPHRMKRIEYVYVGDAVEIRSD
jgi:hypothetical protein